MQTTLIDFEHGDHRALLFGSVLSEKSRVRSAPRPGRTDINRALKNVGFEALAEPECRTFEELEAKNDTLVWIHYPLLRTIAILLSVALMVTGGSTLIVSVIVTCGTPIGDYIGSALLGPHAAILVLAGVVGFLLLNNVIKHLDARVIIKPLDIAVASHSWYLSDELKSNLVCLRLALPGLPMRAREALGSNSEGMFLVIEIQNDQDAWTPIYLYKVKV